jgi:uncharacterized Fe-S cluster-containing radical SAM superfamily protein
MHYTYQIMRRDEYLEPAKGVITKFGGGSFSLGITVLSDILGCDDTWLYRWCYPKDRRGRDGAIPQNVWEPLLKAARKRGIDLSLSDLNPSLAKAAKYGVSSNRRRKADARPTSN